MMCDEPLAADHLERVAGKGNSFLRWMWRFNRL